MYRVFLCMLDQCLDRTYLGYKSSIVIVYYMLSNKMYPFYLFFSLFLFL